MAVLDGLGRALKALDCQVLGAGDYIFGSLNALQGLDQGLTADVINGYRRLRGCDPAGDVVPEPPPFAGGQCPGTTYSVSFTYTTGPCENPTANTVEVSSFSVIGPVTRDRIEVPLSGTVKRVEFYVNQVLRAQVNVGLNCTVNPGSLAGGEWGDFNVVATNGPDNCGSPPAPLPPPTNINIDVDVEYRDEGDNIVNITVPVEFKPFTVNFNGDVTFPIEFSLGGIDFNGDVSFAPEFNLNVSGPKLPKGGGGTSLPEGDPADERPEAAPEANIIGAVVIAQAISDQAATSIDFSNGPDIFVPRLGSLKFAYSLGGATFWSNDIDIKGPRMFIPCPFSQGADAIAVSPVPGVALTATPIRGFPLATIGDIKVVLDTL